MQRLVGGRDAVAFLLREASGTRVIDRVCERLLTYHASKPVQNPGGLARRMLGDVEEAELAAQEDAEADRLGESKPEGVREAAPLTEAELRLKALKARRSELRGMLVGERTPARRTQFEAELAEVEAELGAAGVEPRQPATGVPPTAAGVPELDAIDRLSSGLLNNWTGARPAPPKARPPSTRVELEAHVVALEAELRRPQTTRCRAAEVEAELEMTRAELRRCPEPAAPTPPPTPLVTQVPASPEPAPPPSPPARQRPWTFAELDAYIASLEAQIALPWNGGEKGEELKAKLLAAFDELCLLKAEAAQ